MRNFYTNKEICAYFGVHRQTIQRWREENGLPYKKLGGTYRYDPQEVDAWIEKQSGKPGASKREMARG